MRKGNVKCLLRYYVTMNTVHITAMGIAEKKLSPIAVRLSAASVMGKENGGRGARITRRLAMMAQIEVENPMTVDWWWDEQEYRVPSRARMKRERQAYEEAEREDREIEGRR